MRRTRNTGLHRLLLGILLLIGATRLLPARDSTDLNNRISAAIENLGHQDFKVREEASRFLWLLGDEALAALRAAEKGDDPEIAARAKELSEKIAYGILPDTPPEVVDLIRNYTTTPNAAEKTSIVERLSNRGDAGFEAATRILCRETDDNVVRNAYRAMKTRLPEYLSRLSGNSVQPQVLKLLDIGVRASDDTAARMYALVSYVTGRIDADIAATQAAAKKDRASATILAFLHRINGQYDKASEAAALSGKDHLYRELLYEAGDWKRLSEQYPHDPASRDMEYLGHRATYCRLARDKEAADAVIGRIVKIAKESPSEYWFATEALLINNESDKVIDILIGARRFCLAAQLLELQFNYGKLKEIATNVVQEALGNANSPPDMVSKAIADQVLEPGDGPWLDRQPVMNVSSGHNLNLDDPEVDRAVELCGKGVKAIQEGKEKEGRAFLDQASLALGTDDTKRFKLVMRLRRLGYKTEADREFRIMTGIASFRSWYLGELLRVYGVPNALKERAFGTAARYRQREFYDLLHKNTAMTDARGYLFRSHDILMFQALDLLSQGKVDESVGKAKQALSVLPCKTDVAQMFYRNLEQNGFKKQAHDFFDAAFKKMTDASKLVPNAHWIKNCIGWFAATCRRRLAEGLPFAEDAVRMRPNSSGYLDTLAELNFQLGKREKAIESEQKALEITPDSAYLRKQLERFTRDDPKTDVDEDL